MFKLNLERLREFVTLLKAADYPNSHVDMYAGIEPSCGTPGCHAGMVAIALAPYKNRYYDSPNGVYNYEAWAYALARFLFNDDTADAEDLSEYMGPDNAWLWGNDNGVYMFISGAAFGWVADIFPHQVIIDHWERVLNRYEIYLKEAS